MNDRDYLRKAIELAKKSVEKIPVGVVIVHHDQIIAESYNSQHADNRVASHAEMKALALAEEKLKSKNIQGCTLYTTCEPCTMCAGALFYAKVDHIVYGANMSDIDQENNRIRLTIDELANQKDNHPKLTQLMRTECLEELYS